MIVPYISREDVSAALSAFIHTSRKSAADGLQHLLLIDLLMTAPDMPEGDEKRVFAVQVLLTGEITRALHEQCDLFRLSPPNEQARSDEVQREVSEFIKIGKPNLIMWSILYYRYVRADLGLSVDELARQFTITPRTITRYHDDGIEMLVQRLIQQELSARRAQVERRLYAMLPYSVPIYLIGRDELLETTEHLLDTLSPCHFLITGTTGVGKTVFVQELLRRQIAAGRLDQLVWLDEPASFEFVRQQLAEQLLREGSEITLRDYLQLYRVVIVLDRLDRLTADLETLSNLLRDLGAAMVILINRAYIPLEGVQAHLSLPEIDAEAAQKLVREMLRAHANTDSEHIRQIVRELYRHMGGNPLALKLAAGLWDDSENWDALNLDIHERLFGQMFVAFTESTQIAWCAFGLLTHPISNDRLISIWNISTRAVTVLLRHGLIEGDEDTGYAIVGAAREYIRQAYFTNDSVRQYIAQLLSELDDGDVAEDVFEQALIADFPELTLEQRAESIRRLWKAGLMHSHWANWRVIFEDYLQQVENVDPDLRIAYGVCLRRLADWESAQQVFYNVSMECGQNGQFAEQAHALVEWSILYKYQGEYQRAQALVAQARRYADRVQDNELLHEATYREAWIQIEQGNGADANRLLATLPESPRSLVIQSEAQLVLGNLNACRSLAERALILNEEDQATQASLYTIIGRSCQQEKNYEEAQVYFANAVTLLERIDDIFRLARAQTNLAAVLIFLRRFTEAGELLADAAHVQALLGDKVGMSTT